MLQFSSALAEAIENGYMIDNNGIRDPYNKHYWQVESSENGALTVWDTTGTLIVKQGTFKDVDREVKLICGR